MDVKSAPVGNTEKERIIGGISQKHRWGRRKSKVPILPKNISKYGKYENTYTKREMPRPIRRTTGGYMVKHNRAKWEN